MKSNKSLIYIIVIVIVIAAAYYFFVHKKGEKVNDNSSSSTTSSQSSQSSSSDLLKAKSQTAPPRIDTPNVPDVNLGDIDTAIVSTYLKPVGQKVFIEGLTTISNATIFINKQMVTNPLTLPGVVGATKIFVYDLGTEQAVNEVEIRLAGGAIDLQGIDEISVLVTKGDENSTIVLESSPIEDVKSVNIFKFGN